MHSLADKDFVYQVCLPFIESAKNQDGGWGFHPGSESRTEATACVVLALVELQAFEDLSRAGIDYLRRAQLPDGSWPSSPGQNVGCWATSLACWALAGSSESREAVSRGLRWISEDWPRDLNLFQRLIRKISSRKEVVAQNAALHGWGWTPNTASWVEPTAFALMAFEQASTELMPQGAANRQKIAKDLLYDRMCPGGGWNCGNPMVYGVPGDPLVEPTAWALLALRNEPSRPEIQMSLEWLGKNVARMESAQSLALAKICWEAYGGTWPGNAPQLSELYAKNEFLASVETVAWSCLALHPRGKWLAAARRGEER
jgi:hypothetical protein